MAVTNHPVVGSIVRVDLNEGFRVPEMRKRRPAVVLSPELPDRPQLCTIVPLSTTPPRTAHPFHLEIELNPPLPFPYSSPKMWVKADIILTVAFHRLRYLGEQSRDENGDRIYDYRVLEGDVMEKIFSCVMNGLGRGN